MNKNLLLTAAKSHWGKQLDKFVFSIFGKLLTWDKDAATNSPAVPTTGTLATISQQNSKGMKKTLFTIFRILIGIILVGKISNWFLNYSDETNQILNAGMFTLIGIAYLVGGFIWDKKLTNIIFLICGIYLIAMNFIDDFGLKSIIGIVCILTPMLIARFSPEETYEKELAEN